VTQLLIFAAIAAAMWKLSPTPAFARGFATLLERPVKSHGSLTAWMAFSEYVGGEHEGRPVTLVLERARRYRPGRLALGLATSARRSWDGAQAGTGDAVNAPRMREALDVLIGRHGLSLELDQGWLKATWKPLGLFVFPGRFDPEKWREVLANMQVLALELESAERTA
jgi:hypothetical protein